MTPWYSSKADLVAKCAAIIAELKRLPHYVVIPAEVPTCDSTLSIRTYDVLDDAVDIIEE